MANRTCNKCGKTANNLHWDDNYFTDIDDNPYAEKCPYCGHDEYTEYESVDWNNIDIPQTYGYTGDF